MPPHRPRHRRRSFDREALARSLRGKRRAIVRTIVALLALAAIAGGLRVWQNLSRSHELRRFDRELQRVQKRVFDQLSPESQTNLFLLVERFRMGEVEPELLRQVATDWQRDFAQIRDEICPGAAPWGEADHCTRLPLRPPGRLTRANELIARAMDMYHGAARTYVLAADLKADQQRTRDPEVRARLRERIGRVLDDALRWRRRADEVYDAGIQLIEDLKRDWNVSAARAS